MTRWSEAELEIWRRKQEERAAQRREEVDTLVQQSRARRAAAGVGASVQLSEDDLHRAVAQLLNLVLPVASIWYHPPNEGKRSPTYGARLKALGMRRGIPDIVIVAPDTFGCRLLGDGGPLSDSRTESLWRHFYIELKTPGNKLTDEQREFRRFCNATNTPYAVCRSLAEVEDRLKEWGLWK